MVITKCCHDNRQHPPTQAASFLSNWLLSGPCWASCVLSSAISLCSSSTIVAGHVVAQRQKMHLSTIVSNVFKPFHNIMLWTIMYTLVIKSHFLTTGYKYIANHFYHHDANVDWLWQNWKRQKPTSSITIIQNFLKELVIRIYSTLIHKLWGSSKALNVKSKASLA